MTHHSDDDRPTTVPGGKPSQAEGERRGTSDQHSATEPPEGKPSQAEGSREDVEEELDRQ